MFPVGAGCDCLPVQALRLVPDIRTSQHCLVGFFVGVLSNLVASLKKRCRADKIHNSGVKTTMVIRREKCPRLTEQIQQSLTDDKYLQGAGYMEKLPALRNTYAQG